MTYHFRFIENAPCTSSYNSHKGCIAIPCEVVHANLYIKKMLLLLYNNPSYFFKYDNNRKIEEIYEEDGCICIQYSFEYQIPITHFAHAAALIRDECEIWADYLKIPNDGSCLIELSFLENVS